MHRRINALERTWAILGVLIIAIIAIIVVIGLIATLFAGPELPSLYENAEGTTDTTLGVGFVTVRLIAVARNDRDGSVHVTNGKGESATWEAANIDEASDWLDRAAVRLEAEGGEFEILGARIFDHATRELISDTLTGVSVFSSDPTTVEFNRIGRLVPKTVDVWIQAYIRRFNQPSYRIEAKPGGSVRVGEGTG